MNTNESKQRDRMFLKLFLKSAPSDVTDEELAYFREHCAGPAKVHTHVLPREVESNAQLSWPEANRTVHSPASGHNGGPILQSTRTGAGDPAKHLNG